MLSGVSTPVPIPDLVPNLTGIPGGSEVTGTGLEVQPHGTLQKMGTRVGRPQVGR